MHRFTRRISFVIASLAFIALAATSAAHADSAKPTVAWVDVSVSTLWSSPDAPRPLDQPALTNPVHMTRWLDAMSTEQKQWLSSHNATQTQVLYGHKVYVLKRQGDWVKIAVPGQSTPKNPLGYPGWVPKVQITRAPTYAEARRTHAFAVVDAAPTVWLYNGRDLSDKFLRISFNTRLPVLTRTGKAIRVATPDDGPKWLAADSVSVYKSFAAIPAPSAADLIKTGKLFMGLPYLWGGRSGFAYDCSGFTATIYQSHGILIPRDASAQAAWDQGQRIHGDKLKPGTLMFYADDHGTGHVYHVGMYIGDGRMMEAFNSATPVRTTKARFGEDYWGARRVLPEAASSH
ncbi:MAG TPA: C40 family peptidase [Oleiagrimonas sp.]|nr:C40 family peptidase [Oleiagrimonas sp.]